MISTSNVNKERLDNCILSLDINDNDTIILKEIKNDKLDNIRNEDIEINTCIIYNTVFLNCKFEKSYFVDVIFDSCDLSNISFVKSTFKRVSFKNCKLLGANFADSYFENTTFSDNNMKNCYLDNCCLNNTFINNCNLESANICNVKHKNLLICNNNLTYTNFSKTSLKNIDLSSNNIEGIILYPEDLRGAIMTEYQALEFVKILGIRIK